MKKIKIIITVLVTLFTISVNAQNNNFQSEGGSCQIPTGWTSCSSNCTFSDCCVVYNPNVSEGACGCYFGIAICKTAKAGTGELSNNSSSEAKVKFHSQKFNDFLAFLQKIRLVLQIFQVQ